MFNHYRLRVDVDPLPDMTAAKAERVSRLILSVRDELRDLLIARASATVHGTAMERPALDDLLRAATAALPPKARGQIVAIERDFVSSRVDVQGLITIL